MFVLATFGAFVGSKINNSNPQTVQTVGLPQFTPEKLQTFDGTDPNKPIYVGLDGLVYDVTPGKEFYQVGGSYHDLAGKDASKDLHIFGGSIIKRKYQVVGTIKQ